MNTRNQKADLLTIENSYIGMTIAKRSGRKFKNGDYLEKVKGFCNHPITNNDSFVLSDGSYIEIRKCYEHRDI